MSDSRDSPSKTLSSESILDAKFHMNNVEFGDMALTFSLV